MMMSSSNSNNKTAVWNALSYIAVHNVLIVKFMMFASCSALYRGFSRLNQFSTISAFRYLHSATTKIIETPKIVSARKSGIRQSPLKIQFLVTLIRNTWVPDALAQLKFSPKHRARDVAKIVLV